MKTILTILLMFICFGLQAQIKEKWVDTDSLNAEAFVFKSTEIDTMYGDTIVNKNYVDNATPDLDSINAVYAEIQRTKTDSLNIDSLMTIRGSDPMDSTIRMQDIIYNDTLLFNAVNWLITSDSSYATNKSWIWLYNLGGD